jgi:hypothetical protein
MRLFTHGAPEREALDQLMDTTPRIWIRAKARPSWRFSTACTSIASIAPVPCACPSLLIHGDSDLVTPPQIIDRLWDDGLGFSPSRYRGGRGSFRVNRSTRRLHPSYPLHRNGALTILLSCYRDMGGVESPEDRATRSP